MDERLDWWKAGVLITLFMVVGAYFWQGFQLEQLERGIVDARYACQVAQQQAERARLALNTCEALLANEDSCCAIQSRCLKRNTELEKLVSGCSAASPTSSGDSEPPPTFHSSQ